MRRAREVGDCPAAKGGMVGRREGHENNSTIVATRTRGGIDKSRDSR